MKITDLSRNQSDIQEFKILSESEAIKIGGGRNGSSDPALRLPKEQSDVKNYSLPPKVGLTLKNFRLGYIYYINSQK